MSPELQYHIESKESLLNNLFRHGSDAWCNLICEARELYNRGEFTELYDDDLETLEGEVGVLAVHPEDGEVRLEVPMYEWNSNCYIAYVTDTTSNRIVKIIIPRYTL